MVQLHFNARSKQTNSKQPAVSLPAEQQQQQRASACVRTRLFSLFNQCQERVAYPARSLCLPADELAIAAGPVRANICSYQASQLFGLSLVLYFCQYRLVLSASAGAATQSKGFICLVSILPPAPAGSR